MTDEEFLIQLRDAFVVEAQEHLQAVTAGLLDLEKRPSPDRARQLVEDTFREAHSLKGAARAVGRTDIESIFQEMESIFADWKERAPRISAAQFDVLNRSVDLVARLIVLPEIATAPDDTKAIESLAAQLRGIIATGDATIGKKRQAAGKQPREKKAAAPAPAPVSEVKVEPVAMASPAPVPVTPAPHESDRPQAAETIRVSMAKMDSLLLQAEEMIALKLMAGQRAMDLREMEAVFQEWRARWDRLHETPKGRDSAAVLQKSAAMGEFLEWNHAFMTSLEKKVANLARSARHDERGAAGLVDELLNKAKKLVMLPCATLLDVFPKQVRDLARDEDKEVDLVIHGREVELDKRILEEMKAPLIHLVRNAVDHGIEQPGDRIRCGKPARSTLNITVSQAEGNKVLVSISDDGRGLQPAKLRASAVKSGVLSAEEAARTSDEAALQLIFQSGVSTSPIVTEVSGRGLGMAIVREKVLKLGGTITIDSHEGQGTTFRILLPVTLATFKGILVQASGQTFVIPVSSAERIKRFQRQGIKTVEGRETVELDGRAVAFVSLAHVLGLPRRASDASQVYVESVVLGSGDGRIAFGVDAVLNEQEVLVKNLGAPLLRVRNIAAATVLGSGTPVLILNTADLLRSAVRTASTSRYVPAPAPDRESKPNRVLVADDSVTSRMLIKNVLETSGYAVETATDGLEALTTLRNRQFDLLVSDVEMPRMNGFELTTHVRADQQLNEMPVVLVTALSSREDKERGIDAGANAYIVKGSFDQSDLLSVISKLI
jgi:two-component system chemotaxis sensor kinase CheA